MFDVMHVVELFCCNCFLLSLFCLVEQNIYIHTKISTTMMNSKSRFYNKLKSKIWTLHYVGIIDNTNSNWQLAIMESKAGYNQSNHSLVLSRSGSSIIRSMSNVGWDDIPKWWGWFISKWWSLLMCIIVDKCGIIMWWWRERWCIESDGTIAFLPANDDDGGSLISKHNWFHHRKQ